MELNTACQTFWRRFLEESGRAEGTALYDCFHFDLDEHWANTLLALVLEGKKRATCSSLYAFEAEGMPQPKVGDLSLVTDFAGNPACVIETTAVTILPFSEMTYDICKREGEDACLETWQQGHEKFFKEDGARAGYRFTRDMPVLFEDFEVVYRLQQSGSECV